mgnify:CR=1 FL=1
MAISKLSKMAQVINNLFKTYIKKESIDNKINSIQDKKDKAALLMIKNEFD